MTDQTDRLISGLTEELEPVRVHMAGHGYLLAAIGLALTIAAVAATVGLWPDGISGAAAPIFYIVNGLLLLLGTASAAAVVRMASPGVGNRYDAPEWLLFAVLLLPLAALTTGLSAAELAAHFQAGHGKECLAYATISGAGSFAVLAFWLRNGAPVAIERASWLVGIAAGALGSSAYGLACPIDTLDHLALWHIAPVVLSALAARLALPRLIRW